MFFFTFSHIISCYNKLVTLQSFSTEIVTKGGIVMDWLYTFLLSVAASITAYYICKWLDR